MRAAVEALFSPADSSRRLGYGAAALGNLFAPMSDQEAEETVRAAWSAGVRHFDVAPHYGLGLAERRLGRALARYPRKEYVLSTKVGRLLRPSPETAGRQDDEGFAVPAASRRVWDPRPQGVRRSLEESLDRLGLDSVDILYLHDPEEYDLAAGIDEGLPALAALREEGLVTAVGVGSKSLPALTAGVRAGSIDLVMVAGRYTLLEQPAAEELLPACLASGVGVVDVGVFNSGALARPVPDRDAHYEYGAMPDHVFDRLQRLAAICAEHGVALPDAALAFPFRHPAVVSVVIGSRSAGQVQQNIERFRRNVPARLWERLAAEGLVDDAG